MRQRISKIIIILAVFAGHAFTQSLTVDEVIQKNIEARGGAEKWAKVQSMKMTGIYRSFSEESPFTIWRKRPDSYRFDQQLLTYKGTICYDGQTAWWIFPRAGSEFDKPTVTPPPHDKFILREKRFEPVFWDYQQKGHKVELIGKEDLEGEEHYKLKVSLADTTEETWYLHAENFLETKMEGPMYDFDFRRYMPMEAFFSDYREVDGVKLPFLIEQEFSIRYRIIKIQNVEINTTIDDAVFTMPASEGGAEK